MKLSRLRKIILEEIDTMFSEYSDIDSIKKIKVTNPITKKPITVGSALTYDQSEPVYDKAKQVVQSKKNIDPQPNKGTPDKKDVVPNKSNVSTDEPKEYEPKPDEVGFETQDNKDYDVNKWKESYIHINKNGSSIIGTPHYNREDGDTVEKTFIKKHVLPAIKQAVLNAKKQGKEIVFIAEGGDEGENYPEGSEQEIYDKYIKKLDPKAESTTFDGEDMSIWNSDAKYWLRGEKSLKIPKEQLGGAMYAMMVGQGDSPEDAMEYMKDGEKLLRKNGYKGKIPPDEDSKDIEELYKLAFPQDYGLKVGSNDISKFVEYYNKERQLNLLRKKNEYEQDGKAVIVIPGASHAYQLSDEWNK